MISPRGQALPKAESPERKACVRAHDHRRPGRARPQPQEHLGRDPARPPDCRDRPLRLRQVQPGLRHHLRRRAAALHGVALHLRQALRRAGGEARRGLRLRPVARDLDRAEDADQQPAVHGRDDDRHRELPQSALRHHRGAALSADRRACAEPVGEPDPRGYPGAARRHGPRAARTGVQSVRRGARVRLHRAAQERRPPADHRRQVGGPGRQGRGRRVGGDPHGRRRQSVRDRPEAREGDQGGDRGGTARRRRAAAGPRGRGREESSTTDSPARRTIWFTATSDPTTSCSTTPRARAAPAAASGSTS